MIRSGKSQKGNLLEKIKRKQGLCFRFIFFKIKCLYIDQLWNILMRE